MGLTTLLFISILVKICSFDSVNIDQVRFTKIQCKMSKNLCSKYFCNVKAFSRTLTAFSISCELTRRLDKVLADVELMYRPLGNYRQITKVQRAEACEIIRSSPPGSPYNIIYTFLNNATNGVVHLCPYLAGPFSVLNYTGSMRHFGKFMPKGDYKLSIKMYDDIDPDGADVVLFWTLRLRTGDTF